MSFNAKKWKVIAFHPQRTVPEYTMDNAVLEYTDRCKYSGVILQSDPKFTDHIADKIYSARKQIGMIRQAFYWAPERARMIAYLHTSLSAFLTWNMLPVPGILLQIGRLRLWRLCKIKVLE